MVDVATAPAAPIAAAPAPAKKATKAKAPKTKTPKADGGKPKTIPTHPSYADMIKKAIVENKEKNGSSKASLLKYICSNYKCGDNILKINAQIRLALKRGVETGALKQVKGHGASGSFKLGEKKAAPAAPKKVAAKKPSTKKPSAEKKAKSPKKVTKPKVKSSKKPASPKKTKKAPAAKKTAAAKPKVAKAKKTTKKAAPAPVATA